jgi:hypothetical protein
MSIVKIRAALEVALNAMTGIIPSVAITSSASGTPAVFTTTAPHLLVSNVSVTISGHSGSTPALNGSYLVVVTGASTFTLLNTVTKAPIASTAGGTGGVVAANLIAWEGLAFATVPLVPYQRVNLLPAVPENPMFGGGYREVGFFQLTLYYPIGRGTADAMTRAELVRSTFPRGSSFSSGGVTVHVSKTPQVYPPSIVDECITVVIRVRYWADLF